MRTPAFGRAWTAVRRTVARVCRPFARGFGALRRRLVGHAAQSSDARDAWDLSYAGPSGARWRWGPEIIDCFPFADGYVVTTTLQGRDTRWQVTPGPVPLGSALAAVTLLVQHGITPQFDRDARPFIPVRDGAPVQIFDEDDAEDARYVYLDGVRTLDEFPEFLDERVDVRRAFVRLTGERLPRLRGQ